MDKANQKFPLEFIKGKYSSEDDQLSICTELIAGEYYFMVEVDLPARHLQNSFILNVYAQEQISIEMTTYSGFLEKALSSCAMQKSKKTYYYPHNESLVFRCVSMTDSNCEYGFLFWFNESEEGVLEEKVVLDKA